MSGRQRPDGTLPWLENLVQLAVAEPQSYGFGLSFSWLSSFRWACVHEHFNQIKQTLFDIRDNMILKSRLS